MDLITRATNIAWDYVLTEQYTLALGLYERMLPYANSAGEFNNWGTLHLLIGGHAEALRCFLKARQAAPHQKLQTRLRKVSSGWLAFS